MVLIRARIAQLFARPILFPLSLVAIGLSYGTLKISRGTFQLLLNTPGSKKDKNGNYFKYSDLSYIMGMSAFISVIAVRELPMFKPLDITNSSSSINMKNDMNKNVNSIMSKISTSLKNLHAPHRMHSIMFGAVAAAAMIEFHQKSIMSLNNNDNDNKSDSNGNNNGNSRKGHEK